MDPRKLALPLTRHFVLRSKWCCEPIADVAELSKHPQNVPDRDGTVAIVVTLRGVAGVTTAVARVATTVATFTKPRSHRRVSQTFGVARIGDLNASSFYNHDADWRSFCIGTIGASGQHGFKVDALRIGTKTEGRRSKSQGKETRHGQRTLGLAFPRHQTRDK